MFKMILKILMIAIVLCGVIFVYDARILARKFFGFGDQNEGTTGMKFLGFLIAIIGGLSIMFIQ